MDDVEDDVDEEAINSVMEELEKREEEKGDAQVGKKEETLLTAFAYSNITITEIVEERESVKKPKKRPRTPSTQKRRARSRTGPWKERKKTMKAVKDDMASPILHASLANPPPLRVVEDDPVVQADLEQQARQERAQIDALTQYEGAGVKQETGVETLVTFEILPVQKSVTLALDVGTKPNGTRGAMWNTQYMCGLLHEQGVVDPQVYPAKYHEFVFSRADTGGELEWDTDFVPFTPSSLSPSLSSTPDGEGEGRKKAEGENGNGEEEETLTIVAVYRLTLAGMKAPYLRPMEKEEQLKISRYPQHNPTGEANANWLASRVGRLTGSAAGDIYGTNSWCPPAKRLLEHIWKKFKGNAACDYGNANEDNCEDAFQDVMMARLLHEPPDEHGFHLVNIEFEHHGLCVCRPKPILSMSPDGIMVETWAKEEEYKTMEEAEEAWKAGPQFIQPDCPHPIPILRQVAETEGILRVRTMYELRILVEYKCPYKRRFYTSWNENDLNLYPVGKIKRTELVGPVPSNYYSQVHHGAYALGVVDNFFLTYPTHMWFAVWAPSYEHELEWPNFRTQTTGFNGGSQTVATQYGTIQTTKVAFDLAYTKNLFREEERYWHDRLMPAMWLKQNGMLAKDELPEYRKALYTETTAPARTRTKRKAPSSTSSSASTSIGTRGVKNGKQTFMNDFVVVEDVGKLTRATSTNLEKSEEEDDSDVDEFGEDFAVMS